MESYNLPVRFRHIGIASLVFGFLGGAFFWWTPLGMVLSLTGLVMGLVGWTIAHRKSALFGLSIAGMAISLAALILDCLIAGLGIEIIRLHAFR